MIGDVVPEPEAWIASAVSTVIWFWMPDTITLVQWPVITTLLVIPLTLTLPPLQAMVRTSLMPETVMFSPAGAVVTEVGGAARGRVRHRPGRDGIHRGETRDGKHGGQAATRNLMRAKEKDPDRQGDHANDEDSERDPEIRPWERLGGTETSRRTAATAVAKWRSR